MLNGRKLDHIGVACTDVEANVKWYCDVLGFKVTGRFQPEGKPHPTYFIQDVHGIVYEMYQPVNFDPVFAGKVDHVAYVSDDIEADYKFACDAGYKICTQGIEDIPGRWGNGVRYFKILSPTGEQVEFSQTL